MNLRAIAAAASTALFLFGGSAMATPVGTFSGDFNVTAYNVTNLFRSEAAATTANLDAAKAGTLGDGGSNPSSVIQSTSFTYSGLLDFHTNAGSSTKVWQFLDSGSGNVSGLDATFGDLTNSQSSIDDGDSTATFYLFEAVIDYTSGDIAIGHDDGVLVFADGAEVGGTPGPTPLATTNVSFTGGKLAFLYVSSNNDPSIFKVDSQIQPVPLPAAGWMLLAGLGALAAAARRKAA